MYAAYYSCVLTAFVEWLIRVITTIIIHITLPGLWDAAAIVTFKLARGTGSTGTVNTIFIRVVTTVILSITLPGFWDTSFIGTLPLMSFTLVISWKNTNWLLGYWNLQEWSAAVMSIEQLSCLHHKWRRKPVKIFNITFTCPVKVQISNATWHISHRHLQTSSLRLYIFLGVRQILSSPKAEGNKPSIQTWLRQGLPVTSQRS